MGRRKGTSGPRLAAPRGAAAEAELDVPAEELAVLELLYQSCDGPSWKNSTNWCSGAPVGDWKGVMVRDGHVVGLSLNRNGLRGELPDLSGLTSLKKLSLLGCKSLEEKVPSGIKISSWPYAGDKEGVEVSYP